MKKWVFLSCVLAALLLAAGFLPLVAPDLPENAPVVPAAVDRAGVYYRENAVATAAAADIVMEQSGYVLSAGNENVRLGMASTTKIMTALLAIELLEPEAVVTVPKEAVGIEGSSIYLIEGEQITVSDLLYGLMLESGNDAATALAIAAGGTVEHFVAMMNERAAELGLEDTHFSNPHGLSADDHYTTAYDLARLTCAALENETFAEIVSCKTKTISDGKRYLSNHNRLLRSYEGCIGVKTGYTIATGRTLVTAAERDGLTLVAVTLNDRSDWADHTKLLDYGFANYESVALEGVSDMPLPVVGGIAESVSVSAPDGNVVLPKGQTVTRRLVMPQFIYAPVEQGDVLGYAEYYCNGDRIAVEPLTAVSSVEVRRLSFWERLFG